MSLQWEGGLNKKSVERSVKENNVKNDTVDVSQMSGNIFPHVLYIFLLLRVSPPSVDSKLPATTSQLQRE